MRNLALLSNPPVQEKMCRAGYEDIQAERIPEVIADCDMMKIAPDRTSITVKSRVARWRVSRLDRIL